MPTPKNIHALTLRVPFKTNAIVFFYGKSIWWIMSKFNHHIIINNKGNIVKPFWYNFIMLARDPFIYPELDKPVTLTVYTKSPTKWLLVDRETGQVYEGSETGIWDKLIPNKKESN